MLKIKNLYARLRMGMGQQSRQSESSRKKRSEQSEENKQMKTNEPIILSRDCEAIQIPSGEKVMLPAGSRVTVTQSLGGSYTVTTDQGYLVRIANKDADAIGEDQLFYCRQRGISQEDAVTLIVNGFCKQVFRELPMEFAVEAQKLLGVSLEGSVG